MTKQQLLEGLASMPDDAVVVAEFADLGLGGNTTSPIIDVILVRQGEANTITLVSDHAI